MACPICTSNANISGVRLAPDGREGHLVECERCGSFFVSKEALHDLPGSLRGDVDRIARVAHGVHRMQSGAHHPFLTTQFVENVLTTPLPSVFEQTNNLIRWLGENVAGPGETLWVEPRTHQFIVGAKTENGFDFLINYLFDNDLLTGTRAPAMGQPGRAHATLTFRGWEHLDRLQRGGIESRKAFMAMKYGDGLLDRIVNEIFRPAVAQTGFSLVRLDDQPHAGLIDDRLRVEIRNTRFLIADLTHDNLGAYWEAGYAEGLGKPVIYTCEREKFEQYQTHFDTNHHLTVIWDHDNSATAAEQLKATIRATLPDEARLTDG